MGSYIQSIISLTMLFVNDMLSLPVYIKLSFLIIFAEKKMCGAFPLEILLTNGSAFAYGMFEKLTSFLLTCLKF